MKTVYFLQSNKLHSGTVYSSNSTAVSVLLDNGEKLELQSKDSYSNLQELLNSLVLDYEKRKKQNEWLRPPSVLI